MERVIRDDTVVSINTRVATVPFRGRDFTCCIHSDLPGKTYILNEATHADQVAGSVEAMKSVKAAIEKSKE